MRRGPKRDLLSEIELATRNAGLRFGVYYSGGLDWSISSLPPIDAIPGLDIFGPARQSGPGMPHMLPTPTCMCAT